MKREILCEKCEEGVRDIFAKKYEGESNKLIEGFAKHEMLCDHCGKVIELREPCYAASIWLHSRDDYYPWESQFIDEIPF